MTAERNERVLREAAERLAAELGQTTDQVMASLREAVSAGLLTVTRRGLRATIPAEDNR